MRRGRAGRPARAPAGAAPSLALAAALALSGCATVPGPSPGSGGETAPFPLRPDGREPMDNGCSGSGDGVDWDFAWTPIAGAERYHLQAYEITAQRPAVDDSAIAVPFWRRSDPLVYVTEAHRLGWRWRVRAKVDGAWTEWSRETVFDFEPDRTDCP